MRSSTDRFSELLFYGVVLLVAYMAFIVVRPFLAPLAWAAILGVTLNPVRGFIAARIGPTRAALVTTILTAMLIVGPVATLVSMLAAELPMFVDVLQRLPQQATPERLQAFWNSVRATVPVDLPDDPTTLLRQGAQAAAGFLAPRIGGVAAEVASSLGSLFVMLFALFFVLRDGERLGALIRRVLPFAEPERERLIAETQDLVVASVGAGLAVAAVQGFIGGIAFWAFGVAAPVAWGTAMAICSLIPVVGAFLIWGPFAVWWFLSGEYVRAIVLTIIGAGVIGSVDNVLRPIMLSGRTSVNGLVIFIGLLGGVGAFGFVGFVLGPIVLVTAGTLLDALTRRRQPAGRPPE
jgi:predicted PurR-regulated permease PerM